MVLSHSELISSTIKKIGILVSTSQGYCEDQKRYDSNPAGTQQMSDSLTFYLYENIMQNNLTMMLTIMS